MKYSEKIEIAVPLRFWVILLSRRIPYDEEYFFKTTFLGKWNDLITHQEGTPVRPSLTAHSWKLLLQKRVRLQFVLFLDIIFRELQAIDSKESQIFYDSPKKLLQQREDM